MTIEKRAFDLICGIGLSLIILPLIVIVAILVLILDGQPIFYVSERMRSTTESFKLVKFRTMVASTQNTGVSGGDKSSRITRSGHFLRRSRFDELPQIWNVLKGDISFVGPRPPLREYVDKFPDLYGRVLKAKPGITGLATIKFHDHEEMLLSKCATVYETDAVYTRACIPRKAKLDLIYLSNWNVCFDLHIMFMTVFKSLR